jgi:hypothetical protein
MRDITRPHSQNGHSDRSVPTRFLRLALWRNPGLIKPTLWPMETRVPLYFPSRRFIAKISFKHTPPAAKKAHFRLFHYRLSTSSSGMQQASLKHFNLPHPLELRRVSLPAVKALELSQLVSHPGTEHPQDKGLNIPVFRTLRRRTVKQRKERHALDTTPPHRRKIPLIMRASRSSFATI